MDGICTAPIGSLASNQIIDERDCQLYSKVTIGNQTWLRQNLNFTIPESADSYCYGNDSNNCAVYGRLYTWTASKGLPRLCDSALCDQIISIQDPDICPKGFHVPKLAEWDTLFATVRTAGYDTTYGWALGAKGWGGDAAGGYAFDAYGFNMQPGGLGQNTSEGMRYISVNECAWMLTNQETSSHMTKVVTGNPGGYRFYSTEMPKFYGYSVRCVENTP
jgi:uncharacterized protein (TIGR02145 family)